jgi:hypothetical protein
LLTWPNQWSVGTFNARFFVRINWHGKTAQQSQLMHGSKGWKKQEPSVGERWILGLRPRDSAGIAHLASVRLLIDAPLAAHAHQLLNQTPLLLSIEACMGPLGGNIFHSIDVCMSSFTRDKN